MTPLAQQLHALLFTAGEAVSVRDLAELVHASEEDVTSALQDIQASITGTGITLIHNDMNAQLVTSNEVAEFLAQFASANENELSKAALETLSIIAYRGPVSRIDIDVMRGVDSRRMVRQLLLRGLIRQLKTSGQSSSYDITEEFLMHMGVTKKEELPNFSDLSVNEGLTHLLNPQQT